MMDRKLQNAFRFFYANAGYIVGKRAVGAIALARAERWASQLGYEYRWNFEQENYNDFLGDHAYWCADERASRQHEHEVFYCVLETHGRILASLGGIIDPTYASCRVIEAELALEAMHD